MWLISLLVSLMIHGCIDCAKQLPCIDNQTQFITMCTGKKGVAVGGICYYVGSTAVKDWDTAFTFCWNEGAVLAQLHTSVDFKAVQKYLTAYSPQRYAWFALRTVEATGNTGQVGYFPENTYWQDSPNLTTILPLNTRAVPPTIMDYSLLTKANYYCYLWYYGDAKPTKAHLCPCPTHFALCQLTNPARRFTLIDGVCVSEPPLESYDGFSLEQCSLRCGAHVSCRSFNYYNDSKTCQLLTNSNLDTVNKAPVANCIHYEDIG